MVLPTMSLFTLPSLSTLATPLVSSITMEQPKTITNTTRPLANSNTQSSNCRHEYSATTGSTHTTEPAEVATNTTEPAEVATNTEDKHDTNSRQMATNNSAVVNAPEATVEPRICPHLQLQRLHDDSLKWKCSLEINDVDDETGESMTHDLCQCLANGWGLKFPATYRGLAARKHLVVQLKMAALLSGFCLCTRSSAAERSCGSFRRRAHVI
ncbi:hypothetical protein IV203_014392 [Nitzschia inconspicua]|uniref:Uncharacterized protein n=1 Tax=Nitzschia inconspicua TaxID=303405 RepID=A0A9K3PS45_9STRA|nr:hypothetical protein IV203_014392 [Nitzschia inconspicua]